MTNLDTLHSEMMQHTTETSMHFCHRRLATPQRQCGNIKIIDQTGQATSREGDLAGGSDPPTQGIGGRCDAKLAGLLRVRGRDNDSNFEERYDPKSFAMGHDKFNRLHTEAFVALARYCQRERCNANWGAGNNIDDNDENSNKADDGIGDRDVFYLDGPDASTSSLLIDVHGFDPRLCYVANRHASTCDVL